MQTEVHAATLGNDGRRELDLECRGCGPSTEQQLEFAAEITSEADFFIAAIGSEALLVAARR